MKKICVYTMYSANIALLCLNSPMTNSVSLHAWLHILKYAYTPISNTEKHSHKTSAMLASFKVTKLLSLLVKNDKENLSSACESQEM